MTIAGAALAIIIYLAGLAGSIAWANAEGATYLLGLLLWTSFFGFSMLSFLMLYWSREHWMK
jgi:hypothetical protein